MMRVPPRSPSPFRETTCPNHICLHVGLLLLCQCVVLSVSSHPCLILSFRQHTWMSVQMFGTKPPENVAVPVQRNQCPHLLAPPSCRYCSPLLRCCCGTLRHTHPLASLLQACPGGGVAGRGPGHSMEFSLLLSLSIISVLLLGICWQTNKMQSGGWNSFSLTGTCSSLNVTMPCWSGAQFCEALLGAFLPNLLASSASRPVFKSTRTLQRSSTRASWLCSRSAKQKRSRTSMCS